MSLEALSRNGHNLQLGEFECAGPYQIPVIQPVPAAEKVRWIPFNSARTDALRGAHGVHFFIDDYLFERCWNDPDRYAKLLSEFQAVLSPDFSMFTDYPPAVQWLNGLIAVWTDGEKESNEIVAHWTDSFKSLTDSTRTELQTLKDTADKNGYTLPAE